MEHPAVEIVLGLEAELTEATTTVCSCGHPKTQHDWSMGMQTGPGWVQVIAPCMMTACRCPNFSSYVAPEQVDLADLVDNPVITTLAGFGEAVGDCPKCGHPAHQKECPACTCQYGIEESMNVNEYGWQGDADRCADCGHDWKGHVSKGIKRADGTDYPSGCYVNNCDCQNERPTESVNPVDFVSDMEADLNEDYRYDPKDCIHHLSRRGPDGVCADCGTKIPRKNEDAMVPYFGNCTGCGVQVILRFGLCAGCTERSRQFSAVEDVRRQEAEVIAEAFVITADGPDFQQGDLGADDVLRFKGSQTLAQWQAKYDGVQGKQINGAYVIPDVYLDGDTRRELWNLSDYLVSSVTGGSIWLTPKTGESKLKEVYPDGDDLCVCGDIRSDHVGANLICKHAIPVNSADDLEDVCDCTGFELYQKAGNDEFRRADASRFGNESVNEEAADIGDGYYLSRAGLDGNGNYSVWVAKGSGRAQKLQTNGNVPLAHQKSVEELVADAGALDQIKAWFKKNAEKGESALNDGNPDHRFDIIDGFDGWAMIYGGGDKGKMRRVGIGEWNRGETDTVFYGGTQGRNLRASAMQGIYVVSSAYAPKRGDEIDYYSKENGDKKYGRIVSYDGSIIIIDPLDGHAPITYDVQTESVNEDPVMGGMADSEDDDPTYTTEPVEAYGNRGMDNKSWRKTFKSRKALDKWVETGDGDISVTGTRKAEAVNELETQSPDIGLTIEDTDDDSYPYTGGKTCAYCDAKFTPDADGNKYCSKECYREAQAEFDKADQNIGRGEVPATNESENTVFAPGDTVVARRSTQGLSEGHQYTVVSVDKTATPLRTIVEYRLSSGNPLRDIWVPDLELFCDKAGAVKESVDVLTGEPLSTVPVPTACPKCDNGIELATVLGENFWRCDSCGWVKSEDAFQSKGSNTLMEDAR